jgi:hypothetical protein
MPEASAPLLFAGPSTHGLDPGLIAAAGVQLRSPVRRDDVRRLVGATPAAGTLIVCDGVFQSAAAVSHAELCLALDAGWQVWGVSSLGAIRAHEMREEGMRGFGEVFAMFARFDDFTDDELCLLHFPEPPWFPVTEALVNLRHALATHGPALGIGEAASQAVVQALRGLWFGDRTTDRIRALLSSTGGCTQAQADALLTWLASHRLKTLDLQTMLMQRPWAAARGRTP